MVCMCRNLGRVLFMDEDSVKVPFMAGSMTDDEFVSAGDCRLRNTQVGKTKKRKKKKAATPKLVSLTACMLAAWPHT